jgi:hypothetical protein
MNSLRALLIPSLCAVLLASLGAAGAADAGVPTEVVPADFVTGIDRSIGIPEQFAIAVPYSSGLLTHGTWTSTGNTRTWRLELQVPGAVSLSFHASRVALPASASLSVTGGNVEYTYSMAGVHGGELWSRIARGDTLSFELTVNAADASAATFDIVGLQAGFRTLGGAGPNHPYYDALTGRIQPDSGTTTCVENFECHISAADTGPGDASVALVISGMYQCSAVLLNDVPGDGTPYVLTARHCENGNPDGGDPGAASSVSVYFDATTPCAQPLGNIYNSATTLVSGATTVVEQQDAWLIRLFEPVTVPNAYFAGWDATGAEFAGGYTAHFGLGNDLQYTGWAGTAYYGVEPGSDLDVQFTSTLWALVNGVGSLAPGSSGSGVFDPKNHLVGTIVRAKLQGTAANSPGVCPVSSPPAPSLSTATAFATALSGIYASTADPDSTTGSATLRSVLDPQNTGTLVVNGTWTPPVLVVSATTSATGSAVQLNWSTASGTACTASGGQSGDGWGGVIPTSGYTTVTEYASGPTTYVVTCSNSSFTVSNRVTVNWTLATPAVGLNLAYGPAFYNGFIGSAQLTWSSSVEPCVATGGSPGDGWAGTAAAEGSRTVTENVAGTYTYVMTCGSGTRTATTQLSLSFAGPSARFATLGLTTTNVGLPIEVQAFGSGTTCTTSGGTAGDGWAGLPVNAVNGEYNAMITETTPGSYSYSITCSAGGRSATASLTLTYISGPPTVTVTTTPANPLVGVSLLQLSWNATVEPCQVTVSGYVNETSNNYQSQGTFLDQQYIIGPYAYTVTCGGGAAVASTTVNWTGTPRLTLQTSSATAVAGTPMTLSWNSNVAPCTPSGGSSGDGWSGSFTAAQGSVTVTETQPGTVTYGLACGNTGQTAKASTTVVVDAGPVAATLTASAPTGTTHGPPVVLTWSSNTSPCLRSGTTGYWGSNPSTANTGSDSVTEGTPGTYRYTIQCGTGASTTATAQVAVTFSGPQQTMLSASVAAIGVGQPFTLTWASGNSGTCVGSGGAGDDGWLGPHTASGTMQLVEASGGFLSYGLTCGGGTASTAYVTVQPQVLTPNLTPNYENGQLFLPALVIGDMIYTNVDLPVRSILGAPGGAGPSGNLPSYDPVAGLLTVPVVSTQTTTFYNVTATVGAPLQVGEIVGADSYDGMDLTIPSVQLLGGAVYNNVVATVARVISVAGGLPLAPRDQYDPSTGQLLIPAVTAQDGATYTNVTVAVGSVVSVGK